eukprot:4648609-Amphidinium_carterae.1
MDWPSEIKDKDWRNAVLPVRLRKTWGAITRHSLLEASGTFHILRGSSGFAWKGKVFGGLLGNAYGWPTQVTAFRMEEAAASEHSDATTVRSLVPHAPSQPQSAYRRPKAAKPTGQHSLRS